MNAWTYRQKTGEMCDPDGALVEVGYSGAPGYVNRPIAERREDEGPLPTGTYTIGAAVDRNDLGPCSLPLVPYALNEMHGRSGFYIHGDTAEMDQTASTGCIILSRTTRDLIAQSSVRDLVVEV